MLRKYIVFAIASTSVFFVSLSSFGAEPTEIRLLEQACYDPTLQTCIGQKRKIFGTPNKYPPNCSSDGSDEQWYTYNPADRGQACAGVDSCVGTCTLKESWAIQCQSQATATCTTQIPTLKGQNDRVNDINKAIQRLSDLIDALQKRMDKLESARQ